MDAGLDALAQPSAVGGQVQALEDECVHGIPEQDLGEGVLSVGGIMELLDGLLGQVKQVFPGDGGLELLDPFLHPREVKLVGGCGGLNHGNEE